MPNTLPWGFHRLADIADQRITDNIPRVRDAINEYISFRNAENQGVLSTFTEVTTESQAKYKAPGSMRLQPLSELGRPLPQRYAELEYTVAWPIQKAGLALGQTYEQRVKMNISQFAGYVDAIGDADLTWLQQHALAAMFYNGAGWLHDDPEDSVGNLTILGLANGDSQQYFKNSTGAMGTDQHYNPQAADLVSATDPVLTDRDDLMEHPQNSGDVILLGSTADRAKYIALSQFLGAPNPNVTVGVGVTQFTGSTPGFGLGNFLGYHLADVYIYLWRGMPSNYYVMFPTGGQKPIRQREHAESQLRGFGPEADREDYPYFETDYVRRAGFGAYNRVGAVVRQFNSASYGIPTGFSSPMP